jgi:hypothetical protein
MDDDVVFYRTQKITTRASQESTPRKPLSSLPRHGYNFERRKNGLKLLRASVSTRNKELHKAVCDRERNPTQSRKKHTHTPKKHKKKPNQSPKTKCRILFFKKGIKRK